MREPALCKRGRASRLRGRFTPRHIRIRLTACRNMGILPTFRSSAAILGRRLPGQAADLLRVLPRLLPLPIILRAAGEAFIPAVAAVVDIHREEAAVGTGDRDS